MEQSLFIEWVNKYFPGITISVVEKLNDTKNPLTYLHRRFLKKDYSVTGKWEALTVNNTIVAADVVAMDSSLPLKVRDSIAKANGDIPKMGMELKLNEKQLTDLNVLVAQNADPATILVKLFSDTPKVISGIYERNEAIFLEGLSTGLCLVEDTETVGTGIRINYQYLDTNKFGVATLWTNTASKPFDDIKRVMDKAVLDGNVISTVLLDSATIDNIANTDQAKQLYAFKQGFVGTAIPTPDLQQLNSVTSARYGFTLEKVDRAIRTERNGVQTSTKPWAAGAVVFLTSDQLGSLTWATLAEKVYPVANVTYQTVDDFILVSKYRTNRPSLGEWTSSQARVVPVISNVDQIYLLDSTTLQG
jgi:hypothetical protein